jgi:GTPase Era involved in 16S rRNA processing
MEKEQLRELIVQNVKQKTGRADILKLVLAEHERTGSEIDKVMKKITKSNNECLSMRKDEKLESENVFLNSFLTKYATVLQLAEELRPLGLDSSGPSRGKAIKHLKSSGLLLFNEDVEDAIKLLNQEESVSG